MERWKPKVAEFYYFISSSGDVLSDIFDNDNPNKVTRCNRGNCFPCRDVAEAAAEKFKSLLLSLYEEQPVTDCNQLPKLTTEVFDRPDCPEWAKYAAVDADGDGFYYEDKPRACEADGEWLVDRCIVGTNRIITDDFDPTDWQNSLIERPVKENKLPDWCKVGAYVWSGGEYFEVTENHLSDDWVGFKNIVTGVRGCYTPRYLSDHFKQARLRPYSAEEMKALMGKVIKKGPSMHIVTGFENVFDNECMVHVNGCLYGAKDLLRQFTINNKPAGVLEHLDDKGEWIK